MTQTKMSKAAWNKAVDAWLEEQVRDVGVARGVEWPPEISGLRGGIENRMATPDLVANNKHCADFYYYSRNNLFLG